MWLYLLTWSAAQAADQLVQSDVKGIMNFTPVRIDVPEDVSVHQIDLGIELQSLLFFMNNLRTNS